MKSHTKHKDFFIIKFSNEWVVKVFDLKKEGYPGGHLKYRRDLRVWINSKTKSTRNFENWNLTVASLYT